MLGYLFSPPLLCCFSLTDPMFLTRTPGGFEAFTAMLKAKERQAEFPELRIPAYHIPVTISNNVPGTEYVWLLLPF